MCPSISPKIPLFCREITSLLLQAKPRFGKDEKSLIGIQHDPLCLLGSGSWSEFSACGYILQSYNSNNAGEQITKTIAYLSKRRDKTGYGAAKRGGYHIGSGGIESSNKFISNVRLKRSGAWWYTTHANNILKLRCAKYNGTYDRIMDNFRNKNKNIGSNKNNRGLQLVVNNSCKNR